MPIDPKIKLYQIYYDNEQLLELDPDAEPYDNSTDESKECEYGVMRKEYFAGNLDFDEYDYIGFVSWKWNQKSNVTLSKFLRTVRMDCNAHPDAPYDVYAFNPYPWAVKLRDNVWLQGDDCPGHENISDYAQQLFDKLGYDNILVNNYHSVGNASFCNYWVGNKRYWDEYIKFIEPFRELMLNSKEYGLETYDPQNPLGFYPFVVERLWTEFINMKSVKYKIFRKT